MRERTLEELKNITESDYLQLVAYAEKRLSMIFYGSKIPEGRKGQDFVQEVLTKILEGIRKWNQAETPDFKKFLFSSLKSEISNFTVLKVREKEIDVDSKSDHEFWSAILDSDNFLEKKLQEEAIDFVFSRLDSIESNLSTLLIMELEGYETEEIAKEMEIEVKDVYNLRKRLKRHGSTIWHVFINEEVLK